MKRQVNRTEDQLLVEALQVQDACNLSGVVHSFSRAMSDLWTIANERGEGTQWVNTHPVALLYGDKVRHLTQTDFESLHIAFSVAMMAQTDMEKSA